MGRSCSNCSAPGISRLNILILAFLKWHGSKNTSIYKLEFGAGVDPVAKFGMCDGTHVVIIDV